MPWTHALYCFKLIVGNVVIIIKIYLRWFCTLINVTVQYVDVEQRPESQIAFASTIGWFESAGLVRGRYNNYYVRVSDFGGFDLAVESEDCESKIFFYYPQICCGASLSSQSTRLHHAMVVWLCQNCSGSSSLLAWLRTLSTSLVILTLSAAPFPKQEAASQDLRVCHSLSLISLC